MKNKKEDQKHLFAIYITVYKLEHNYINSSFKAVIKESPPKQHRGQVSELSLTIDMSWLT